MPRAIEALSGETKTFVPGSAAEMDRKKSRLKELPAATMTCVWDVAGGDGGVGAGETLSAPSRQENAAKAKNRGTTRKDLMVTS